MSGNGRFTIRMVHALSGVGLLAAAACGGSSDEASPLAEAAAATDQPVTTTVSPTPRSDTDPDATSAYVRQVNILLDDLAEAAATVAAIMDEADIDSADWRSDAATALSVFGPLQDRAEGFEVSRDVEHIQERLLVATDSYHHAAALLGDSIGSLDLDALEEANLVLGDALLAAAEVRLLIEELAAS